jgi:hypothetical protein
MRHSDLHAQRDIFARAGRFDPIAAPDHDAIRALGRCRTGELTWP